MPIPLHPNYLLKTRYGRCVHTNNPMLNCLKKIFLIRNVGFDKVKTKTNMKRQVMCYIVVAQNKEGILPVTTLSIALYVLRRSMSDKRRRTRGGNFVIGFININKYTSAFKNVHLCLKKTRQLGYISVTTGRIPSLFCGYSL